MSFKLQKPMLFSVDGYKSDSKDVDNNQNLIASGDITMQGVDFPVHGVDNLGNEKIMTPGEEYTFPGDTVLETPIKNKEDMPDFNENKGFKLGGFPMIDGSASVMKQKEKLSEFDQAFSDARNAGKDVFDYKGEQINTMQLGEEGWVEGSDALEKSGQMAYQGKGGGSTILNPGKFPSNTPGNEPTWQHGNPDVPVPKKEFDIEDDNNSPQAIADYKMRMKAAGKKGQTKEN